MDPQQLRRQMSGMALALVGAGLVYFYFWAIRSWERYFMFAPILGGLALVKGIFTILSAARPPTPRRRA